MCNSIDLSQLSIDLTLLSIYSTLTPIITLKCADLVCFYPKIGCFGLFLAIIWVISSDFSNIWANLDYI